ncbi:Type VI secretion system, RhsGE-associated Vgr protein [Rhabdaerophilaceae bacterium]
MPQQDTVFELSLSNGTVTSGLTVEEMRLSEAISQPYSCQIRFISKDNLTPAKFIGEGASLKITRSTGSTMVRGVATSFARQDKSGNGNFMYSVTIEPRLSLLDLNHQNRVFGSDSMVKIKDIVEKVCEKKISISSMIVGNNYPSRDFVVQHNESDLQFLMRQCENYGVYFYFDTKNATEEKVIFEDSNTFQNLDTNEKDNELQYVFGRHLDWTNSPVVWKFAQNARVAPGQVTLRDYNPAQPSLEMKKNGSVTNGLADFVRMEYGANFVDVDSDGKLLADVRAEELGWQAQVFDGVCNVPSARAGTIFELTDSSIFEGSYIIVSAEHDVATPAPTGQGAPDIEGKNYRVAFKCIRSDTKYRPPRITPKPNASGLLTAKVDGAANSSIAQIDDKGRYKVRFHLDSGSASANQEKASEYVRRAGEYAGPAGTGMHLPMLRDTEVVLACLNGDIDRPVIIGSVPNGANPNVVTSSNAVSNLLVTPSAALVEINDGTTAGTSGATYQPFVRMAAPTSANDIAGGSYFRLGAFISTQETARMPSKASTAPLKYTKHTVASTTNPAPEPDGNDWQDYVDAAEQGQDSGSNSDGSDKGLVTADATGKSEGSVPASEAESSAADAEASEAEATVDASVAVDANGKVKKGYSKISATLYLNPGYSKGGSSGYVKPGFNQNSSGVYLKQEYGAWTKTTVNGHSVYVKPGYKLYGNTNPEQYLKPGFIAGSDGEISKNKSSQLELNTISLVEVYNTAPSGNGALLMTDKDFEMRVDGGAVVQIGKGHHLKVKEGDYQVAVDDGAVLIAASSGVDIRGGSSSKPANLSLTAYGYIKQEAKGPVSEWSYSTKETRTYGYSKDWFYGEKFSEFHGKDERIFFGSSKSRTYGASDSVFMGARSSIVIGKDFSLNIAVRTSILVGGNISVEISGFLKATLAFGASVQLAAEYKLVAGAYHSDTFGSLSATITGSKMETITGISTKTVTGIDMKTVTGIDMKNVKLAIEFVDAAFKNKTATVENKDIEAAIGKFNLKNSQFDIVACHLTNFF